MLQWAWALTGCVPDLRPGSVSNIFSDTSQALAGVDHQTTGLFHGEAVVE